MLKCLGAVQKRFEKSAVIYHAGDIAHAFGLVLSGRVQVENDDFWGNKSVLASIEALLFLLSVQVLPLTLL